MHLARRLPKRLAFTLVAGAGLLLAACSQSAAPKAHTAERTSVVSTTSSTTGPVPSTTLPPTTTTAAPAIPGIAIGPGPQSTYHVQGQPAPGSCHYSYISNLPLPDPRCTPGAVNPAVTPATLGSTICRSGYTSSIRPPESVTEPEKVASAAAYGYTGPFHTAEYDHLISLEIGGDPNDATNLWVEPNDKANATTTSNTKDVLENTLHHLICTGQITLAAAQHAIATNWVSAYRQYDGPTPTSAAAAVAPATTAPAQTVTPTSAGQCFPLTNAGNCYKAGETCRDSDHGAPGKTADGEAIRCEDNNGWRWEAA